MKTMTLSKIKKTCSLLLAVLAVVASTILPASAKSTSWEPLVNVNGALSASATPSAHTKEYSITLGWFTTSKKVTLGSSMKYNSTYGVSDNDAKRAASMARFDVTVQYNGKNKCFTRYYKGLKAGDSFTLNGKAWNESKKYTVTVKSYFANYRTAYWSSCFCNYQMKY